MPRLFTLGASSTIPTFIVTAGYDQSFLDAYSAELYANLCRVRARCPASRGRSDTITVRKLPPSTRRTKPLAWT